MLLLNSIYDHDESYQKNHSLALIRDMRRCSRLYAVIGLAFFSSLLYSGWRLSSFRSQRWRVDAVPGTRLVVFGDSWSDNERATGGRNGAVRADETRTTVWTDVLCSHLKCEHHENLARSLHYPWTSEYDGAVVDNENLNVSSRVEAGLPDLGDQLGQWIQTQKELERELPREYVQATIEKTIFVIFFGLWDIWHASELEANAGLGVIERSIDLLVHRIGILAGYWGKNTLKIILPLTADPTLLPGWRVRLHPETNVRVHRNAVSLTQRWNENLEVSAHNLRNAQIYVFDTNGFIADQIRDRQMYDWRVWDADGWGKRTPMFEVVDAACLGSHDQENSHATNEDESPCHSPEKYLFWDGMHLGGTPQKMMAQQISEDIAGNFSNAWVRPNLEDKRRSASETGFRRGTGSVPETEKQPPETAKHTKHSIPGIGRNLTRHRPSAASGPENSDDNIF